MDIVPLYKRVIGLDVHQAQITGRAITEQPDGSVTYERREFGGFKRDRKALSEWARSVSPDVVANLGFSPRIALEIDGVSAILDVVDLRLIRQTIEASLKTA